MACKCENVTHPLKMNGFLGSNGDGPPFIKEIKKAPRIKDKDFRFGDVMSESEFLHIQQRLQLLSQIRSLELQNRKLRKDAASTKTLLWVVGGVGTTLAASTIYLYAKR